MAKQSGLGDYIAVDDSGGNVKDISNDITGYSINIPQNLLEITGLDKSATERLIGLGDGTVSLNGVFNKASNKSHDVFKVRTGTRTVTIAFGGNTSGYPKLEMEMLVTEYNLERGDDGALKWTSGLSLQSGTVPTYSTV
tara:strand:+ start:497 stop:913 length:417 start_codon:yes stop_codon:yes gene_type:complete